MARLRSNFQRGTLTSGISSTDTTLASAEFSALPTVASPDYLILVLDPDATAGNPELVKVTAHTSSASSVTVTRGQENTTNRIHANGMTWRHVATVNDWDRADRRDENVRYYGALGNGSTDDATAIQAACTAATDGAVVYFPPGTYIIGSTITVPRGCSLVGAGPRATVIQAKNGTSLNPMFDFTGTGSEWNTECRGFHLNGIAPNGIDAAVVGLKVETADMKFHNLRIIGCSSKNIQNLNFGNTFSECEIIGNSSSPVGISLEAGASSGSNHINIDKCIFVGHTTACIDMPSSALQQTNIVVNGCDFEGIITAGVAQTTGIRVQTGAQLLGMTVSGPRCEDMKRLITCTSGNAGVIILGGEGAGPASAPPTYLIELDGGPHGVFGFQGDYVTSATVRLNSASQRCQVRAVPPPLNGGATDNISDGTGSTLNNRNILERMENTGFQWSVLFSNGTDNRPAMGASKTPTVGIYFGTGSPESARAAGVGSLYFRTDGGTSTTLYVKESGTGNTGWIPK